MIFNQNSVQELMKDPFNVQTQKNIQLLIHLMSQKFYRDDFFQTLNHNELSAMIAMSILLMKDEILPKVQQIKYDYELNELYTQTHLNTDKISIVCNSVIQHNKDMFPELSALEMKKISFSAKMFNPDELNKNIQLSKYYECCYHCAYMLALGISTGLEIKHILTIFHKIMEMSVNEDNENIITPFNPSDFDLFNETMAKLKSCRPLSIQEAGSPLYQKSQNKLIKAITEQHAFGNLIDIRINFLSNSVCDDMGISFDTVFQGICLIIKQHTNKDVLSLPELKNKLGEYVTFKYLEHYIVDDETDSNDIFQAFIQNINDDVQLDDNNITNEVKRVFLALKRNIIFLMGYNIYKMELRNADELLAKIDATKNRFSDAVFNLEFTIQFLIENKDDNYHIDGLPLININGVQQYAKINSVLVLFKNIFARVIQEMYFLLYVLPLYENQNKAINVYRDLMQRQTKTNVADVLKVMFLDEILVSKIFEETFG